MVSFISVCSVWNGIEIGFGKNVKKALEKNWRQSIEEESLQKA